MLENFHHSVPALFSRHVLLCITFYRRKKLRNSVKHGLNFDLCQVICAHFRTVLQLARTLLVQEDGLVSASGAGLGILVYHRGLVRELRAALGLLAREED